MRSVPSQPAVTVVVPTFDEESNVVAVAQRIRTVFASGPDHELLFVDDGSRDGTRDLLAELARQDPRIRVVLLTRNFGHQAAVSAGLRLARGRVVAVMDADLQDPPEVLPRLLEALASGYAVAYGVRRARKEGWLKRSAYHLFYRLLGRVSDVPIPLDSGDFCAMDRRVVDFLNLLPERGRFLRGLRAWVGLPQIGVEYERQARLAGDSKYSLRKLCELATSGLVSFSRRPLQLATQAGFLCATLSLGLAAFTLGRWLLGLSDPPQGFLSLFIGLSFLFGVQFLLIGILGEYIGRIHEEVKRRPSYLVQEILGVGEPQPRIAEEPEESAGSVAS